jgi:hypothetical protein
MIWYIVNYINSFFHTVDIQMSPINTDLTQSCIITHSLTPNAMNPLPSNKFSKN